MHTNFLKELKSRGLISKIANKETLFQTLSKKKSIKIYCGFDPTSDSLHVGHLLPLIFLKHFYNIGSTIILVIGGATCKIGDPSFKHKERTNTIVSDLMQKNREEKISKQIKLFFKKSKKKPNYKILNNFSWFKNLKILSFLRLVGKKFTINNMIKKESVKNRLIREDTGISFTEFSYSLLQAYDFFWLFKNKNVQVQIGGSDQWGNIVSGIVLIKKIFKKSVSGITTPLLIQSNGTKFGKTEKGTIWLDESKTSCYTFYQFWINIEDIDLIKYLKLFTFINLKKIKKLKKKLLNKKIILKTKRILAEIVTIMIHGKKNLLSAQRTSRYLFSNQTQFIKKQDFQKIKTTGFPTLQLKNDIHLQEVLVLSKLSSSKRQSRNLIKSSSIKINKKKQTNMNYVLSDKDKIFNKFTLISKGKRDHYLIVWT